MPSDGLLTPGSGPCAMHGRASDILSSDNEITEQLLCLCEQLSVCVRLIVFGMCLQRRAYPAVTWLCKRDSRPVPRDDCTVLLPYCGRSEVMNVILQWFVTFQMYARSITRSYDVLL